VAVNLELVRRGARIVAAALRGVVDGWRGSDAAPPNAPSFRHVADAKAQIDAAARPFCAVCGRPRLDSERDAGWYIQRPGASPVVCPQCVERCMGKALGPQE